MEQLKIVVKIEKSVINMPKLPVYALVKVWRNFRIWNIDVSNFMVKKWSNKVKTEKINYSKPPYIAFQLFFKYFLQKKELSFLTFTENFTIFLNVTCCFRRKQTSHLNSNISKMVTATK